ncbi:MAG TPA: hypothetical protein VF064_12825 [Pyrinomonadaceae bacterium]
MDRKLSANRIALAALAAFALLALCVADLGALAQNANSSTTADPSMENHNMMTHAPARRRRGSRRRPRPAAEATDASMAADASAAQEERTDGGEQADLSGTYAGRMTMRGSHDMAGEATLTITGNTFTLAGEGMNHSGRVLAVTTRGYTGASFFFSDLSDADTKTPVVAAVRARKTARGLTLTPVPGTRTRLTFNGRSSS